MTTSTDHDALTAGVNLPGLGILQPDDSRHGTAAGYDAHRRIVQRGIDPQHQACAPCKAAVAAREARRQLLKSRGVQLRLHPCGMQRRLQALVALGYSYATLDRHLGHSLGKARDFAIVPRAYVDRVTHDKIRALYDQLSMTPAPTTTRGQRQGVAHARRTAARYGFVPPLAWDEGSIDDPHARPYVPVEWGRLRRGRSTNGYPVDVLQARAALFRDCYEQHMTTESTARELGMAGKHSLEKWVSHNDGFCRVLRRMYGTMHRRDGIIHPDQRRVA